MTFNGTAFMMEPHSPIDFGSFYIKLVLNDGYQDMIKPAIIKFTINYPPFFEEEPTDQIVYINSRGYSTLPKIFDSENQEVTILT